MFVPQLCCKNLCKVGSRVATLRWMGQGGPIEVPARVGLCVLHLLFIVMPAPKALDDPTKQIWYLLVLGIAYLARFLPS